MILISREHLCVYTGEEELEEIDTGTLIRIFRRMPANLAYFETADRLYGIVSCGDILRSGGNTVAINKHFTSLGPREYMRAREIFQKSSAICEIPVVENGRLTGEFHKFDDELRLDRAIDPKYNAYAPQFFRSMRNVALVRPTPSRTYKQRCFRRMKELFDRYRAAYAEISTEELLDDPGGYDTFIVADEQERRGAFLFHLLTGKEGDLDKLLTCRALMDKLVNSQYFASRGFFERFRGSGVEFILLTARHSDREYVRRTTAEMNRHFPRVDNDLLGQIKDHEADFFDDLADQREYMDSVETCCFFMDRAGCSFRLRDLTGKYINVRDGKRVTVDQPEEYTRTIYFFGACLIIGAYVSDEYTIESRLQKRINQAGHKVRVVNCGCWGDDTAAVERINATGIRSGDIVVAMFEETYFQGENVREMDLWDVLEENDVPAGWMLDMPQHVNHHVSRLYADRLYDMIFTPDYRDLPNKQAPVAPGRDLVDLFYIRKYFHGVDLGQYKTAACCVLNGNPFTEGHRYLVRRAAEETEHVYLLTVEDDSSLFSFGERYAMAVEAVRDLKNVTVVPSGIFQGNAPRFPAYFAKVYTEDTRQQAEADMEAFASLAELLHVTHRYLGEESSDPVTNELNLAACRLLPKHGIQPVILGRKESEGCAISGSYVRKLAAEDDPDLERFVPRAVADIIRCDTLNRF